MPFNQGTPATATAIIGNSIVRSSLITMKFDRVSQTYFAIQLDKAETFTAPLGQIQYPLTWAPDVKIGQSTVTIDGVVQLRENYTLSVKKVTVNNYTSYSGLITFITPPAKGSIIVVNYIKDISLLNAQDRIQFYYTPGTGALGQDLAQLMTGIDYGGVQLTGLGFEASQGWASVGYMTELWDSYEDLHSNYSVAVDSTTQADHVFTLPYIPAVYTNLNIYYSEVINASYVSDGTTTVYGISAYFNQLSVTATFNKTLNKPSSVATSVSTKTVTITGTRSVYNYLYGPTADLTVGTPVQFIAGIVSGLVLNQTYYIASIVDSNTFTISASLGGPTQTVITVSSSSMSMRYASANNVISADASRLSIGMPIQFTGIPIGTIQPNTTYYVKTISNDLSGFIISSTIQNNVPGDALTFATATGSMIVNQILGAGQKLLTLDSVDGLKVGDAVQVSVAGAITPGTVISSINTVLKQVTLSSIVYADVPNSSTVLFVRTLTNSTDYLFITNVSIQLNEPIAAGAAILLSSNLDAVRIDDPNYGKVFHIINTSASSVINGTVYSNVITSFEIIDFVYGNPINFTGTSVGGISTSITYYILNVIDNHNFTVSKSVGGPAVSVTTDSGSMTATSIANKNALMPTYVADGISSSVIIPQSISLNAGDILTFRNSTSDGSIADLSNIDTRLDGGDLPYTTATGLNPDDILVDGDGFVTPTTSPAPEEVVPGQVVDTLAVKVYERSVSGSAVIKVSNYIASGSNANFSFGQYINNKQAIVVKSNNVIKINGTDYNVDYRNKQIIFVSTPAAGTLITIESFGFNGSNILDLSLIHI